MNYTLQPSKSKLSIMIVEDDVDARETLCLMVKMKNPDASIYSAENGSIGMDLFKKNTPDIVITDVNMPVMNGIDMAGEIKSIKADTKFIVLTAYNEEIFFQKFSKCLQFYSDQENFQKYLILLKNCYTLFHQSIGLPSFLNCLPK